MAAPLEDIPKEGWFDMLNTKYDPNYESFKGAIRAKHFQKDADIAANPSSFDFDKRMANKELASASDRGEYASSGSGDLGQFAGKKKGGKVRSHASKRADGCCQKGHTKGRMV
jgi:hypothetical protein